MGYNPKWTAISEPDGTLGYLHRVQIWERDYAGAEDDTWQLWGGTGTPDILVDHGELSHDLWKPTVGTGLRCVFRDPDREIFLALRGADERAYYLIYSISDDGGTAWFDYFRGWCRSDLTERSTDLYTEQTIVGALCGLQSLQHVPFAPFDLEGTGIAGDFYEGKFRLLDALCLILNTLEPGSPSVAEMDLRVAWPYTSSVHLAGDPYAQLYNDYSIFLKEGTRAGQAVPVPMTCLEVVRELVIGASLMQMPGTSADPAPRWRLIHPALQTTAHTAYNYQTADGLPAPDPTTSVPAPTPISGGLLHGKKLLGGSESARQAYRTVTFIQKHDPINPTFIRIINESLHPAGTGGRATFVEATATNVTGGTGRRLALEVDLETLDLSGAPVEAFDGDTYEVIINFQWKFGLNWIKDADTPAPSFVGANPLESFNVTLGKGTEPKPRILTSPELPDTTDDVYLRIDAGSTGGEVSPEPVTSVRVAIVRLALDDDESVTETLAVVRNGTPLAYSEDREEEYVIGDRIGSDFEVGLVKGLTVLDGTHQWTEDWGRTGATHYPTGATLHQVVAGDVLFFQNAPAPIHREVLFGADIPLHGGGVDIATGSEYEGLYPVIRVLFQPLPDYRAEVGLFRIAPSPSVPLTYDDIVKALPPKREDAPARHRAVYVSGVSFTDTGSDITAHVALTANAYARSATYKNTTSSTHDVASGTVQNIAPSTTVVVDVTGLSYDTDYWMHTRAWSGAGATGVQGLDLSHRYHTPKKPSIPQGGGNPVPCMMVAGAKAGYLYRAVDVSDTTPAVGDAVIDSFGLHNAEIDALAPGEYASDVVSEYAPASGLEMAYQNTGGAAANPLINTPPAVIMDPLTTLHFFGPVDNAKNVNDYLLALLFDDGAGSNRECVGLSFWEGSGDEVGLETVAPDGTNYQFHSIATSALHNTTASFVALVLDRAAKTYAVYWCDERGGWQSASGSYTAAIPTTTPDSPDDPPVQLHQLGTGEVTALGDFVFAGALTEAQIQAAYMCYREHLGTRNPAYLTELPAVSIDGGGGVVLNSGTFADGDTTPSVRDAEVWYTANTGATTITDFDDGLPNQRIYVYGGDANTTIADNANINNALGLPLALAQGQVVSYLHIGGVWYQQN